MNIESKRFLHIIDKYTLFSSASFLSDGEKTKDVWHAYMTTCLLLYIGYSETIHVDQGTQFQLEEWKSLLAEARIRHDESGVESHNAPGSGERYHSFSANIYRKVQAQHLSLPRDHLLYLALKGMNETTGPTGLCPVLFVFGVVPKMPLSAVDLPNQREGMKALKKRDRRWSNTPPELV